MGRVDAFPSLRGEVHMAFTSQDRKAMGATLQCDAAGRRILIVDTCHAGRAEGSFESHSLLKRSASSMFPLIVASKGEETSQEYPPAKHGLFTYALMTALAPAADKDNDYLVSLQE